MTANRGLVLGTLETKLAPLIGASMARSSIRMHSEKLGIDDGEIRPEKVEELVGAIGLAMRVFVGKERADALTREVLDAVGSHGNS